MQSRRRPTLQGIIGTRRRWRPRGFVQTVYSEDELARAPRLKQLNYVNFLAQTARFG
jgi:hypothetical protein